MFDTLCVLNNRVVCADPNAFLILFDYTHSNADNHLQSFRDISKFKIPLPNDFKVKKIFLDVVENHVVGLKCLVILALNTSNEVSMFMYCGTLRSSVFRLKNLGWPKCSSSLLNKNLFLTNGPTLVFFHEDVIQIYSLLYNARQFIELKKIIPFGNFSNISTSVTKQVEKFPIGSEFFKVLQVTSVGQLNNNDPMNVILLIVSYSNPTAKEVYISSLGINVKQHNQQAIHHKLSNSLFFPKCFQNVLQSILVTNISCPENSTGIKNVNWKDNYTFLSTQEEFMVFSQGTLKYVTQLSLPGISSIKADFCNFKLGHFKLILMSEDENVHLLATDDSHNHSELQLSKTWASIKSVMFGDILLNGSKHLLLLKDTHFHSWHDSCIISDVSSSNPVDLVRQTSESDASTSRAIPGLLAKVQRGKLSITEAESKISKKLEATLDALFRLKDYNSEDEHMEYHVSSFQESLVDIILHKDENCRAKTDASKSAVNLKVQNHWIKFIDDRCVCCWTFNNNDERTIFNPAFVILVQNQQIQCVQKLFVHKFDGFSIEDECRRQVNPGERFSVVVSLEVPEFHSKNIEVSAILSWYVGTSLEFENEIYLQMEEKTLIQQQMNLRTDIKSSDVFQTQLKDMSSADSLACFKVIQQRIILTVFSLHSDVTRFENDLMSSAYGAAHLLIIENLNMNCLVFKSANLPLYGVHLIFKSLNSKTLEMEAFTKNDKETYLLVQFLYKYFPQDVVILPSGIHHAERSELKHQALRSMKKEVDLLLSTFTIHNIVEMTNENNSKVLNEAGTVVVPKEIFLRMRKTLVKKECATDNIMQRLSCGKFSNESA